MSATVTGPRPPGRVFAAIERVGRLVPHPFYLFWYLLLATGVLSAVLAAEGATAQLPGAERPTEVRNILSVTGLQHLVTTLVPNFIGFPPLGVVLVVLLGVGVAERTGLLRTAVAASLSRVPRRWMPLAVCFVAGQGHVMGDAGFIVLPPLAALAFRAVGRHPVAGMLGAFAGLSAGYGSGLLIGALDANLSALTTAAVPSGTEASTSVLMNYWFQAAAGLVLPIVVAAVLVRWVEPTLRPYDPTAADGSEHKHDDLATVTDQQRRALRLGGLALLAYLAAVVAAWLVPGGPLQGEDGALIDSPFFEGIVPLVTIAFLVAGLAYGIAAGTITRADDVPRLMAEAVMDMRFFIVVAFSAGQFIAMFAWSGVGDWIAVEGSSLLRDAHVGGLAALLLALLVTSVLALVIFSGSSLWAVLSPVFVPIFVGLGIHPATIQATYRIGDSIANPISPLNPYLYVLQDEARRYDPDLDLGQVFARMALFVLPVALFWVIILIAFYLLGVPTGPGAPVRL
ncbi:AbgT family transporter [Nocardioides sp. TRM66260-LWL]|uniref:AbgT family transporter n=1 Tax=Nocardioides sp. TRM66260-LWL TaxID=2874478 RepID=UPI001CC6C268|nr:AbgT family transporter [Nocardioides sp. TRM66260-LWL]MBZ5735595.1 AbgT family transporter [Nocardioides sp. TRM66260-LWL]